MKTFKCNICPAEFKTKRGLDNHKHRWICPICGTKLVTASGYERHVKRHEADADEKEKRSKQAEEAARQKEIELPQKIQKLKESGLFIPRLHPGDKVILSTYSVTKPTHEGRWNRMVRVRYEEERRYYADTFTVVGIKEPDNIYEIDYALRNNKLYPVTYMADRGKTFTEDNVFKTIEEAEVDAMIKRDKYREACDFASQCR